MKQARPLVSVCLMLLLPVMGSRPSEAAAPTTSEVERFKATEIRVIRPRYFNKRRSFELGLQLTSVMNEAFIYTFLGKALATYHFTEIFALEFDYAYGANTDKENKRILFDEFEINTLIFRTQYAGSANLVVTPIYGKWQLSDGDLLYFDTFFDVGFGQTALEWRFSEFCETPTQPGAEPVPSNRTVGYPTIFYGVGQRYFISKSSSIRWDVKGQSLRYDTLDTKCVAEGAESKTETHTNITFSIGMSRFL